MEKKKLRKYLGLLAKLLLTGLALWIVFGKIDLQETLGLLRSAFSFWLLLVLVFYNLSKLISSIRLNGFFRRIGLDLSEKFNLKLYYAGMFYNLFLPGGVGGDGYKLIYLRRHFKIPTRFLIQALFVDRVSGMVVLIFLAAAFILMASYNFVPDLAHWGLIAVVVLIFPVYFLVYRWLFPKLRAEFVRSGLLSFGVQLLQVVAVYFILLALGIRDHYLSYLILFLLSSIATIIPLTIGGMGVRELVFLYASSTVGLDEGMAVAVGLLFFLATALSSFAGVLINVDEKFADSANDQPI